MQIRHDEPENVYVVNLTALKENIRMIQALAGPVPVWAVLKGNGYGLGLQRTAHVMSEEGISRFCVAEPEEARVLAEGKAGKILMLQPFRNLEILRDLLRNHVICTVSCLEDARAAEAAAEQETCVASVHLKIDTGMGRYGFRPEETENMLQVFRMKHVQVEGMYTHFACSSSGIATRRQFRKFQAVREALFRAGVNPGECHCCNSAAFFRYPQMRLDGVRLGTAFLGRVPDGGNGLHKIGYCRSYLAQLHPIPKGGTSGYGGAWRAKKDSLIAMIPVGWYHGFGLEHNQDTFRIRDCIRSILSRVKATAVKKRLWVTVRGKSCPVCGHVGMMYTAVDVTDISCSVGDPAELEIGPLLQRNLRLEYRTE